MKYLCLRAAALAATVVGITACSEGPRLPDTLQFPPGTPIEYRGQPAKLYGHSLCAQGQLTGQSCLIFPPEAPRATGVILLDGELHEVQLQARPDPRDPTQYLIEDLQGRRLFATRGHHDYAANIDIRP